jgi:hypothetical protein
LQDQIDQLKAQKASSPIIETSTKKTVNQTEPSIIQPYVSDLYSKISATELKNGVDGGDDALIRISIGNNGPNRAAGVKLTAFYLMPLFDINNVTVVGSTNHECEVQSRGIIQCTIGTVEAGAPSIVDISANPKQLGKINTWTVDLSTTTLDSDMSNNHITYSFQTGSTNSPVIVTDNQSIPIEGGIPQQQQQNNSALQQPQNNNSSSISSRVDENVSNPATMSKDTESKRIEPSQQGSSLAENTTTSVRHSIDDTSVEINDNKTANIITPSDAIPSISGGGRSSSDTGNQETANDDQHLLSDAGKDAIPTSGEGMINGTDLS